MVKCKECGKEFKNDRGLHAHIKLHKLKVQDYYYKHFPRKDLHTGEFITFKNKDQYLNSDFNNKNNMRLWLKKSPKDTVEKYCKEILLKRKERKKLNFSPSQIELRTITAPPLQFYNETFGDYYKLCESLGFNNKFKTVPKKKLESDFKGDDSDYSILVDTREQQPLKFNYQMQVETLPFGDYAFSDLKMSCNCFIERKSLNDFIGTLSGGYTRFRNEIERAIFNDCYLVVLVERNLNECKSFNYLSEIKKKMSSLKVTPDYIFHNVRELIQDYHQLQFLFVDSREESVRVIEKIFTTGCAYKDIDLQYAYDMKFL